MGEQPSNDRASNRGGRNRPKGQSQKKSGGGGQGKRSKPGEGRRRRRRRPNKAKTAKGAAPLDANPILDAAKSAEEPLATDEVKDLAEHFRFIAKHRKLLRLKPNAAEDRLLNGSQTPEHRGVCMHLLGKVDRASVKSALARLESDGERTGFLAGVVRFSNDPAILLSYLEALSASRSRSEAASALGVALGRIDFSDVSAAQMRRILELIVELFEFRDRPQMVLGLLESPTFKSAFDAAAVDMPPLLAELLGPLRAVHAAVFCGEGNDSEPRHLERGVALLLQGHAATLRSYPEIAQRRLFELGLRCEDFNPGPLEILLNGFAPNSRVFSVLATALAREYLRRHDDKRARVLLEKLRKHQPGFRLPGRWVSALDAEQVGRISLFGEADDRGWQQGLWLDHQRPVLVRKLAASDTGSCHAFDLHRRLLVPGVAPLLASEHHDEAGYAAVEMVGRPGRWWRQLGELDRWMVAYEGVAIAASLLRAGVLLPDLALRRFLIDSKGRLWLFDLSGAISKPDDNSDDLLAIAMVWCEKVLPQNHTRIPLDAVVSMTTLAEFLLHHGRQ